MKRPPAIRNYAGAPRRVGVEIEFAGIDLDATAAIVAGLYGGSVDHSQPYVRRVGGTQYGEFRIEIDAALLLDRSYEHVLTAVGIDLEIRDRKDALETLLENVASVVVPTEIVCPPIPIEDLEALDDLRAALHAAKAKGTRSSLLYAFGLQFNPELSSLEPASLLAHIQAFLLKYDWICRESMIDLTRRLAPYIREFPGAYLDLVLSPTYAPTRARLIDDYLEHNPTRNRPLDMLPAFAFLDENRVAEGVERPDLVKSRPTFHYRLPNCLIDEPDWSIGREWDYWVAVEELAADRLALARAITAWRAGA